MRKRGRREKKKKGSHLCLTLTLLLMGDPDLVGTTLGKSSQKYFEFIKAGVGVLQGRRDVDGRWFAKKQQDADEITN